MKKCNIALCIATAIATLTANAGTSTWIAGSSGGWADPASWDGGVPGAGDTVAVPNNADLPVADADAAFCGAVDAIVLGEGSRIVFNLESDDCSVSGTITGSGQIVKNGTGTTLHLLSEEVNGYRTTGGVRVNGGTVECPQTFSGSYSSVTMNIGPLHVAEGAVFMPYAAYRHTIVTALSGTGTIRQTKGGGYWPLRVMPATRQVFEGRIDNRIRLDVRGPLDLLCPTNSFLDGVTMGQNSDLGVISFGLRDSLYSGIGAGYRVGSGSVREYIDIPLADNKPLRYLGTGETTDKHFKLNGAVSAILDSGATGGLVLSGKIYQSTANQAALTLTGSNTVASALSCAWEECGDNSTYLAKAGTGTWTLYGTTNRLNAGVIGVEGGTLRFDSLAETNIPCSFGLSTRLAQKYTGTWDATKTADYAILLGSADAEGTLEYIGTNLWDNAASTRPVAVTGMGGRIVSSVAGRRIGIKGAFAADSAGATLTLDGAGTTNYLYNVSDGHGTMSLAKEGTGTWVLAGDQTFGGKLDVKGGEVVVSSTLGSKYSWYRFTVKRTLGVAIGDSVQRQVRLYELALYDTDGNRLNLGLTEAGANSLPTAGEVCYWRKAWPSGQLPHLFLDKAEYVSGNPYLYAVTLVNGPFPEDPNTWVQIIMRLADDKAEAAFYDVSSEQASTGSKSINAWTMEASADGLFWDTVANVESNDTSYATKQWISDGSDFTVGAKRILTNPNFAFGLDKGKSLLSGAPSQLANATISVANGAVLRAEGDVAIKSLEIDAAKPAGTIDGFSFASGGTLSVKNSSALGDSLVLPVNIINASNTGSLASWAVEIDGKVRHVSAAFAGGALKISEPGTVILMR